MRKLISKIINFGYKSVLIFSTICFSISLIGATFFYVNRSHNYLNPFVLIVGSILYFILISKLYKFLIKLDKLKKKRIVYILLGLQFILLLLSTFIISSVPKVDLIHILTEINSLNNTGEILNNTYFSVYPNNKFLVILLYSIQKISPSNSHILFSLISSLSISIMSLFTYKTVTELYNEDKGLLSLFICVFSPIFYLYVSYYYTDVLMLPFASILFYLMIKIKDEEKWCRNIIYGLVIGIIAIIGYKIRAVAIFLLVAYFIYLLLFKKFKVSIKKIVPIILGAILTLSCITKIENNFFTNLDSSKEFPITHWIMMGFNENSNGYYSQDDYNLSFSAKNVSERKELNIKEIKTRLSDMGFFGTIKLMVKKINAVWGKGDYSYQKYLELVQDNNISYRYLIEDKNIIINYLLQFSKIITLALAIVSLINMLKNNENSIIAIALFGAIIFYLIWEVCPRYGLSFLPWMIILGCNSYDYLNINYEKNKKYRYLKYSVLLLSIVVLGIGFFKYTRIDERSNIVAKNTVNKVKYITLNKDINITQGLDVNSKFNQIKLKFRLNEENIEPSYIFELLNENEEVIYKELFKEKDLVDKKYKTFELDKDYPKGNYTVKLSSNNDSDTEVYISYKEGFDYYQKGLLKVNDVNETGDLMFEISNVEKRGVFTYLEYLIIIVLTLIAEYILLFRKKEKVNEKE